MEIKMKVKALIVVLVVVLLMGGVHLLLVRNPVI
jgi:hypothetical protein